MAMLNLKQRKMLFILLNNNNSIAYKKYLLNQS